MRNMGRTCVRFKALPPSRPVERLRSVLVKADLQLSIGAGSVHDSAMSNRAPLHGFEIIFYSTASLLAAVGLTWYFLH
jgi:hypothetical protein